MELTLSVPCDLRFADTAGSLAVHAARQAGCSRTEAEAFGRRVAACVRESIQTRATTTDLLPVVVRHGRGPVEVLVNGHVLTPMV